VTDWGVAGLNNTGPHGLSEILYAYSSSVGNNGSAFAGLTGNPPMAIRTTTSRCGQMYLCKQKRRSGSGAEARLEPEDPSGDISDLC